MRLFWKPPDNFENPDKKFTLDEIYTERISDIKKIFEIFYSVLNSPHKKIELDFSKCTKISTTELNILAALGPLCFQSSREICIETGTNSYIINRLSSIDNKTSTKIKSIPFKKFNSEDDIIKSLLSLKDIVEVASLPPLFYNEIWSRLYELCSNAHEHGENPLGAVCNGFCENNILTFSVFDFGKRYSK